MTVYFKLRFPCIWCRYLNYLSIPYFPCPHFKGLLLYFVAASSDQKTKIFQCRCQKPTGILQWQDFSLLLWILISNHSFHFKHHLAFANFFLCLAVKRLQCWHFYLNVMVEFSLFYRELVMIFLADRSDKITFYSFFYTTLWVYLGEQTRNKFTLSALPPVVQGF